MNKLNQMYKLGQRLYYVHLKYKSESCPICKGKGLIKLKEGISLTCPKCYGSIDGTSIGRYIVTPVKIVKITTEKCDSKLWRYIIKYTLSNDAILSEWIDNKGNNEFSLGNETFIWDSNFIFCTNKKEAEKKANELTKLLADHLNRTTKGYIAF